jgi:tetratricopeptide (TPR) repeat protein
VLAPFRADLLLLRAEVLAATDRWVQAQTPLETLLKVDPGNADGLLLRATIAWKNLRDGRTAIEVIQDAFATHPEDLRFPELQGRILYDQGQKAEARIVLTAVLARDPGRLAVARFLLDDAVGRSAWTDAQHLLDGLPPPTTEAELIAARTVSRGLGDTARAVTLAERLDALAADRRNSPLLVQSLLEAGAKERALALIPKALEGARDGAVRSDLYYLRAVAAGEPASDDAVRDLQRALAENPSNANAMIAMARHYLDAGQARKAQQYASSALRDRPTDQSLLDLMKQIQAKLAAPGGQ